jgi:competence protein ComEC
MPANAIASGKNIFEFSWTFNLNCRQVIFGINHFTNSCMLIFFKFCFRWVDNQLAEEVFNFSIWFVLSFAFGIVCFFGEVSLITQIIVFVSSLFLGVLFYWIRLRYLGIFIFICALGVIFGSLLAHFRYWHVLRNQICSGEIISVSGNLDSIRPVTVGKRTDMSVITVSGCKSRKFLLHKKVAVYCKTSDLEEVETGDVIKIRFKIGRQKRKILPGGYDFSLQNLINKVDFSGYSFSAPVLLAKGGSTGIFNYLRKIRYRYYQSISLCLPKDEADFAAALIIGESQGLNREIMGNMRCAGLSHVLCVSGLHLTLIAGICFVFLRTLLNSIGIIALSYNVKILAALLSWFASAFYWILSGMNVATTRAFIMTSVGIFAVIFDRKVCSFRTLTLAMFIVLLVNPADIMSVSFQLSFASVLALIGGYNLFGSISHPFSGLFGKFCSAMIANFYSSLVVSCITAPIAVYNFYVFSVYQILGNLAVLPVVSVFLMPITVLAIVLIPFESASWILNLMAYGINFVTWVASSLSYLPFSLLYIGQIGWSTTVMYVIGVCWLLLWKSKLRFFGIFIILISFLSELNREKATIMFDSDNHSIGFNNHGCLTIYGDKSSPFLQRYWTDWFGQREILRCNVNIKSSNFFLKTDSGLRILILNRVEEIASDADLVISTLELESYGKLPFIGKKEFERLGNFVIYCKRDRFEIFGTKSNSILLFKNR